MKYFKPEEFACPCCDKNDMDSRFLILLDELRANFGRILHINSGFRCAKHNKIVGGKPSSQHLFGKAVDVSTVNMTKEQRETLIAMIKAKFDGIGYGKTFLHLDLRGYPASWTY